MERLPRGCSVCSVSRWGRYCFAEAGRLPQPRAHRARAGRSLLCREARSPLSTDDVPGEHRCITGSGSGWSWAIMRHPTLFVAVLRGVARSRPVRCSLGCPPCGDRDQLRERGGAGGARVRIEPHLVDEYNVVLLAQPAFVGARGGDALSIDALDWPREPRFAATSGRSACAARGRADVRRSRVSQAARRPLHAALGAIRHLRNQLLCSSISRTCAGLLVDWLIDDPWRYHLPRR